MKLSKNLSLSEVLVSQTAKRLKLTNEPTQKHLNNLKEIAINIFQPVREGLGKAIYVSSGYRSKELNKAIKGSSKTSQHTKGQALDLDADVYNGVTNRDIFNYIKDNLEFDQLILECVGDDGTGGWIHVSYVEGKNRGKIMSMNRFKGKPVYKMFGS